MSVDVSIVLPSIRPKNLIKFYEAARKACKKYNFEIIIPGPYLLPEELMKKGNVTFLHTYANPTIAFQQAALLCNAEFIYNTTDDGLIEEDALDLAIDIFREHLKDKDMINMQYKESVLSPETLELIVPREQHSLYNCNNYWYAYSHGELRLAGIRPNWKICPHFFMKLHYFYELGGFECIFEYSNHALHDLAFRVQADGGDIYDLPKIAFLCSHLPGKSGDHGPIVDAQTGPDIQNFLRIYSNPNAAYERIKLNYNQWKKYPNIWDRRFDKNNLVIYRPQN